jgi:chromosome segregation ATPase
MGSEQQQQLWARVTAIEANPAWRTGQLPEAHDKQRVLKGVLLWDLDKQFKHRLWQQQRELKEIGEQLELARTAGRSVNVAVDGIPYRVERLTQRIDALNPRIAELSSRVTAAMTGQVKYLQEVAVDEMSRQRYRLTVYRAQANFALASIYDRAATVTGQ